MSRRRSFIVLTDLEGARLMLLTDAIDAVRGYHEQPRTEVWVRSGSTFTVNETYTEVVGAVIDADEESY